MNEVLNTGEKIKKIIRREDAVRLQEDVEALIKDYINNCSDARRVSCASLCLNLLGEQAYEVEDEIFYMKSTFRDLLAFLTDPEISSKFSEIRTKGWSNNFAEHLSRMLLFLDRVDNNLAIAEMRYAQLEDETVDINRLISWKEKYQK